MSPILLHSLSGLLEAQICLPQLKHSKGSFYLYDVILFLIHHIAHLWMAAILHRYGSEVNHVPYQAKGPFFAFGFSDFISLYLRISWLAKLCFVGYCLRHKVNLAFMSILDAWLFELREGLHTQPK